MTAYLIENTSSEAVNNQEEYSRGYKNIGCVVFQKDIPMTSSHVISNIPLDLIWDQCYPLHAKSTSVCFMFALVISNSQIFDHSRLLTS